jgi:aspartokinase
MGYMAKNQTSLTLTVWRYLDQNPCLRTEMIARIINVRALAKHIIKEQKINASIDAVISAIRRYDLARSEKIFENAKKIIGQVFGISTRNRLTSVYIAKNEEIQKLLPKLFSVINYNRGDVLRIIHADESISIFIDEKNLKQIKTILKEENITKIYKNIASINITLKEEALHTPGVVSVMANELAINNINVLEFMYCVPQLLWFVAEEDLPKAYNVINQLCQQNIKSEGSCP